MNCENCQIKNGCDSCILKKVEQEEIEKDRGFANLVTAVIIGIILIVGITKQINDNSRLHEREKSKQQPTQLYE